MGAITCPTSYYFENCQTTGLSDNWAIFLSTSQLSDIPLIPNSFWYLEKWDVGELNFPVSATCPTAHPYLHVDTYLLVLAISFDMEIN